MSDLRSGLDTLRVRQRVLSAAGASAVVIPSDGVPAIRVTVKPIERVLVRYATFPKSLRYIVRLEPTTDEPTARNIILHNALARYYCVRRWVWRVARNAMLATSGAAAVDNDEAAHILHTLLR